MDLWSLPWGRAREVAASGAPVFLLVNPVEFHGPHLSLHNDAVVSRALASELHAELVRRGLDAPLVIAGELEIGVDPVPGPGSRHTSLAEAEALVVEACTALVELGARRVVLLTFHGAPLHSLALHAGIAACARRGVRAVAPLDAVMKELPSLDPSRFADVAAHIPSAERERVIADLAFDYHAGFLETAVALALAPDHVDASYASLPPCPEVMRDPALLRASRLASRAGKASLAADLATAAHFVGWKALRPFPGYTGRPHLASVAAGRAIVGHLLRMLGDLTWAVLEDRAPVPPAPMAWLSRATLGGRLLGRDRLAFGDIA